MRSFLKIAGKAILEISKERVRQEKKWGEQDHDPSLWLTILSEEMGEFSRAALCNRFGGRDCKKEKMLEEAIHVAAVSRAMVECLLRNKWKWHKDKIRKVEMFQG